MNYIELDGTVFGTLWDGRGVGDIWEMDQTQTVQRVAVVQGAPRALELIAIGSVSVIVPLVRPNWLEGDLNLIEHEVAGGDIASGARIALRIEKRLRLTFEERAATREAVEPWALDLERVLERLTSTIKPPRMAKRKAGRQASGLRNLSPADARYALTVQSLAVAKVADGFQREVERRLPNSSAGSPTLERLLQGDLGFGRVTHGVASDGLPLRQEVMRGDGGVARLRAAGLTSDLIKVAERFMWDVEQLTIGKLSADYSGMAGGRQAGEPERVVAALQRLARAQRLLTRKERLAVWGTLVFGLSLTDVGYATDGDRLAIDRDLRSAATIHTEAALDRMAGYYLRIDDA